MIDTILVLILIGVLLGVIELLVRTSLVVAPRVYGKVVSYAKQIPLLIMATTTGAIAMTIVSLLVLFVAPITNKKKAKAASAPSTATAATAPVSVSAPIAAAPTTVTDAVPVATKLAANLQAIPFPAFAWAKDIPTALPFPNPWKASRVSRAATPIRGVGAGPTKQA